ncbi:hypothetical protein M406DRAFT_255171 [Cryphonectria parasitica EP155]|uniref:Ubiquitin-like domain-containing protein n=1 Tax=Cryphonectria parasitica (strain ATCC 38755 / EP155) TaxID=660469 RepID=A0A9P4Y3Q7_CRYP1|nr:uncharacterized protein M406DRAFT_255171 [Cryphonectria parasitica EP155]KAF3765971.1 hypothetical protein M406DRAFT_255171 [Cryphonectria parasitica EP155]
MSEVTFAKSFLSAVGSRPQKLSPDHVEDPKNYPARPPYILPKMPKPMSKRVPLAPGQERSVTVHIKSLRNPPLEIKLTSQPLNTSILDVKTAVAEQAGLQLDKIKVLHKKKPVADAKVLKDLLSEEETSVEFSVMTDEFWTDLRGFLSQRIRDEKITEELFGKFLSSWESR